MRLYKRKQDRYIATGTNTLIFVLYRPPRSPFKAKNIRRRTDFCFVQANSNALTATQNIVHKKAKWEGGGKEEGRWWWGGGRGEVP